MTVSFLIRLPSRTCAEFMKQKVSGRNRGDWPFHPKRLKADRSAQPICGRRNRQWRGRRGPNRSSEAGREFRQGKLALRTRRFGRAVFRPGRWFAGTAPCDRRRHGSAGLASASLRSVFDRFFQQPIGLENHYITCVCALSTFPSQHHPVPYGQADILNARVGLDETVKGDDGVIISILGLYHFAAPQNIVAHDQPARSE